MLKFSGSGSHELSAGDEGGGGRGNRLSNVISLTAATWWGMRGRHGDIESALMSVRTMIYGADRPEVQRCVLCAWSAFPPLSITKAAQMACFKDTLSREKPALTLAVHTSVSQEWYRPRQCLSSLAVGWVAKSQRDSVKWMCTLCFVYQPLKSVNNRQTHSKCNCTKSHGSVPSQDRVTVKANVKSMCFALLLKAVN